MNTHDTSGTDTDVPNSEKDEFHESIEQYNNLLLSCLTQRKPLPSGHLHILLSYNNNTNTNTPTIPIKASTKSLVNNTSTECTTFDV